jgi:hypothetical protein
VETKRALQHDEWARSKEHICELEGRRERIKEFWTKAGKANIIRGIVE